LKQIRCKNIGFLRPEKVVNLDDMMDWIRGQMRMTKSRDAYLAFQYVLDECEGMKRALE
jgi:hypothetical protein